MTVREGALKVLVTGASGFIGRRVCGYLNDNGFDVVPTVRVTSSDAQTPVGNIDQRTDWSAAMSTKPEVIIHLAGRAHMDIDTEESDVLQKYRSVNLEGTLNLALQAAANSVRRFIFLSSIKVYGDESPSDRPFSVNDFPEPTDPYGLTKYEAEKALIEVARRTNMETVIVRSPLVYGPGVKANFASMMRWLVRRVPLPLSAITFNKRSLIAVDNLVDLLVLSTQHPRAANRTLLVSDDEDLSTVELLQRLGAALECPARLFYMPTRILKIGAHCMGKSEIYRRLCGSLQLDISETKQLLDWTPPVSVNEGLRRTAESFIS